jgi:hypothetical protein
MEVVLLVGLVWAVSGCNAAGEHGVVLLELPHQKSSGLVAPSPLVNLPAMHGRVSFVSAAEVHRRHGRLQSQPRRMFLCALSERSSS